MSGYYDRKHLAAFPEIGRGHPGLAGAFFGWYGAVFAPGALGVRTKNLAALAVAHAVRCPYCIDAYTTASLEHGADLDAMTEAVHVAAAVAAASTLDFGAQMVRQAAALGAGDGPGPVSQGYFHAGHVEERLGGGPLDEAERAWERAVTETGALDREDKAAIAVAVAHALGCPYAIDETTRRARAAGLDLPMLTEAVHVAAAIRGGAALVHGIQMMEHLERRPA